MRTHESIGLGIPDILLPKPGHDLAKWSVIACDQFTSEREYWRRAAEIVGDAPSALNLIFPEVYLNDPDREERIARIREHMSRYLEQGLFVEAEGMIYVERQTGPGLRKGILACLDLDRYDFRKASASLIRATEGTILERIPPRVKIRDGAAIELPHIMVLIDDPQDAVLGPLTANRSRMKKLYDFELMMGSGRVSGFRVDVGDLENGVIEGLKALADPGSFIAKYGLSPGTPVLLYAMGDGNHSLATAKTIWEQTKESYAQGAGAGPSPLRYALVEIVNLQDRALNFEPIHRVLFGLAPGRDPIGEMAAFYPAGCRAADAGSMKALRQAVDGQRGRPHRAGFISAAGYQVMEIKESNSNLPVGTIQNFLDAFMKNGGASEIDYVHGAEAVGTLGQKPGNAGIYLPAMNKNDLFKTVILDGALPRKTFSLGEARDKRFYLEARRLS